MSKSIKSIVFAYLKSQVEIQGGNGWLLGMGYADCNDYTETVRQILSAKTGQYLRFETVARYTRSFKVIESRKETVTPTPNQGV
jgi:hypothetical protein